MTPALLLALVAPVGAEPLFRAPSLVFDTGHSPTSVAIADLNGDGRLDLAATNSGSYYGDRIGTVSVLLGNGDGSFGARTDFETGSGPNAVAIGDLNGDGRPDLVTANLGSYPDYVGGVSVLLGNGDGTFGARTDIDAGHRHTSVAIADLNGDGHPDVVTESSALLGNGDGTFGARTVFPAGAGVAIGDLNGDGRPDLATTTGSEPQSEQPAVLVQLGNGDGTFGAPTGFGWGAYDGAVAMGDLNGDGRLDLVVAQTYERSTSVAVLLGNGDGTFGAERGFTTGANPVSVAIADLNGDGVPDLATANYGFDPDFDSNTVSVLLGNGDGTFRSTPEHAVGENPSSLAIADLDGNGFPDLVTANEGSNTLSVLLGTPDGTYGTFATGSRPTSVAIADLNADGWADLAVTDSYPSSTVSVLLGRGDGTFGAGTDFATGPVPESVAIADLNGDGRPDLAVANGSYAYPFGTVSVLLGNGDGTFGPKADYAAAGVPISVAIGDLDADGRPDLVVANKGSNTISVLRGNGDGTFGARADYVSAGPPRSVAIADLNADGWPDLVVANGYPSNTVSVFLGSGGGAFGAAIDPVPGGASRSIGIADLDGDGRPDLVVANHVLLGNGDGTFGVGTDFAPGLSPVSVAVADFNADGRPDVAAVYSSFAGLVTVQLGIGDGTFGPATCFGTGRDPGDLASADLDGNGQPDVVTADWGSNTVSVLLNRSAAAPPTVGVEDREPARVALALRGPMPNPAVDGRLQVDFTLRDGSPARLELLDVAGRALISRAVGALGPGRHTLDLSSARAVAPGIYFLRLTQGGREVRARAAVLR